MNKKTMIIIAACIAGILVLGGVLSMFKGASPFASGKLKVVAAENFWGDIAAQVGGDRVEVASVISDPAADPHLYESGAKDASAITNADIVIVNGLGYDDFVTKILDGSPKHDRVVINIAAFLDAKEGENPHLWYDIGRVSIVAAEFQKQFTAKDNAGNSAYQTNLATFVSSLQPLYNQLDILLTDFPHTPIAYTERIAGYIVQRSGLDALTPQGFASAIEDGNEPSPTDQAAMLKLITDKKIKALLYNAQASSPVTERIRDAAVQNNIPVVSVTETMPAGTTYQAWQRSQLDALITALDK